MRRDRRLPAAADRAGALGVAPQPLGGRELDSPWSTASSNVMVSSRETGWSSSRGSRASFHSAVIGSPVRTVSTRVARPRRAIWCTTRADRSSSSCASSTLSAGTAPEISVKARANGGRRCRGSGPPTRNPSTREDRSPSARSVQYRSSGSIVRQECSASSRHGNRRHHLAPHRLSVARKPRVAGRTPTGVRAEADRRDTHSPTEAFADLQLDPVIGLDPEHEVVRHRTGPGSERTDVRAARI